MGVTPSFEESAKIHTLQVPSSMFPEKIEKEIALVPLTTQHFPTPTCPAFKQFVRARTDPRVQYMYCRPEGTPADRVSNAGGDQQAAFWHKWFITNGEKLFVETNEDLRNKMAEEGERACRPMPCAVAIVHGDYNDDIVAASPSLGDTQRSLTLSMDETTTTTTEDKLRTSSANTAAVAPPAMTDDAMFVVGGKVLEIVGYFGYKSSAPTANVMKVENEAERSHCLGLFWVQPTVVTKHATGGGRLFKHVLGLASRCYVDQYSRVVGKKCTPFVPFPSCAMTTLENNVPILREFAAFTDRFHQAFVSSLDPQREHEEDRKATLLDRPPKVQFLSSYPFKKVDFYIPASVVTTALNTIAKEDVSSGASATGQHEEGDELVRHNVVQPAKSKVPDTTSGPVSSGNEVLFPELHKHTEDVLSAWRAASAKTVTATTSLSSPPLFPSSSPLRHPSQQDDHHLVGGGTTTSVSGSCSGVSTPTTKAPGASHHLLMSPTASDYPSLCTSPSVVCCMTPTQQQMPPTAGGKLRSGEVTPSQSFTPNSSTTKYPVANSGSSAMIGVPILLTQRATPGPGLGGVSPLHHEHDTKNPVLEEAQLSPLVLVEAQGTNSERTHCFAVDGNGQQWIAVDNCLSGCASNSSCVVGNSGTNTSVGT